MRSLIGLLAALALTACAGVVPQGHGPGTAPPPPPPVTQSPPAITRGPDVATLAITPEQARRALASFRESCPKLLARSDNSRLTVADDWRSACAAAATWAAGDARQFFQTWFDTARIGDGAAFVTGYYEPEIRGSRVRSPGYAVPVYRMPADLVRGWPSDMAEAERTGRQPLGRYDASGAFVPYFDRGQIEEGALADKGLEIAWAADPVEFFFLQIQGSGLLRLPDGALMRIGYAGQNGRGYTGIGSVMRERSLIGEGPGQYSGSMQGIIQYIHDNPREGRALMRLNQSWVFFSEVVGDGPFGALNVPVRARASVATDPAFTPLGAPVWLDVDRAEADGLWIAQDTGGAIKGANRFDTFWGNGDDARRIAGGMSARGSALVLLPKGVLTRPPAP